MTEPAPIPQDPSSSGDYKRTRPARGQVAGHGLRPEGKLHAHGAASVIASPRSLRRLGRGTGLMRLGRLACEGHLVGREDAYASLK